MNMESPSALSLLIQAKYEDDKGVKSGLIDAFIERCVREGRYDHLISASKDPGLESFRDGFNLNILRAAFKKAELTSSDEPLMNLAERHDLQTVIRFHAGMALVEKYKADFNEKALNSLARNRKLPTEVRNSALMELVDFNTLESNKTALLLLVGDVEMEYGGRTEAGWRLIRMCLKDHDYLTLLRMEEGNLPLKVEEAIVGKAEMAAREKIKAAQNAEEAMVIADETRLSEATRVLAKMRAASLTRANQKPDGEYSVMDRELLSRLARTERQGEDATAPARAVIADLLPPRPDKPRR
jgi:hypothetical protein